jgi:hypothetical protein
MDRCDQVRQSALAFAVEYHHRGEVIDPGVVVHTANAFHKFLLGGHESLTEKDVVEMEAVIRQDEEANANRPRETTVVGVDPIIQDPEEVA